MTEAGHKTVYVEYGMPEFPLGIQDAKFYFLERELQSPRAHDYLEKWAKEHNATWWRVIRID